MKKVILGLVILNGFFTTQVLAQNEDDKKKTEQVNKFKADCKQSMLESANGIDEATATKLCDCVGGKVEKDFNAEELEALNNEQVDKIPVEKVTKLQETIQECVMSLQ